MKRALVTLLALWLAAGASFAVQPDEVLADKALEARARALSAELRCLVCQNQSIDDSDAPLARDLRILLRERLQAGDTDAEARQYLVERYGDFVLLKPPFNMATLLLWAGPFLVLALAAGILAARRPAPRAPEEAPISAQEAERLKRLI